MSEHDDFAHARDGFIQHLAQVEGRSPQTVRAYGEHLDAYGRWAERAHVDGLRPTARELRRYLSELKRARYAPRTVAAHLSALRSFFRWCEVAGIVQVDVATTLQTPKLPQSLPLTLTHEQMRALLAVPDRDMPEGSRDACMLELFYATGARIAELAGLTIERIDRREGTARLFGKGSKERIVPVYPAALQALEHYLSIGRPVLIAAAHQDASAQGEHPLFISKRGRPMDTAALRYRFRVLARAAGLPADITPHAMRHTFATDLLAGGADLRSVQELLGHASLSTTQLYTHLTPDRLKEAVHQAHPRG